MVFLLAVVAALPSLVVGEWKWTSKNSFTDDCSWKCYRSPVLQPGWTCKYLTWQSLSWGFEKRCKCDCVKKKAWYDDGLKTNVFVEMKGTTPVHKDVVKSYFAGDNRCGAKYDSKDMPGQPGFCPGFKPCCSPWGYCGSTDEHCRCADCLDYGGLNLQCTLDGITEPFDKCTQGTPLDVVEFETGKEQMWNVFTTVAGMTPGVGDLFSIMFAYYDPISPLASAAGIGDNIQKAVNVELEKLQKCMNAKVTQTISTVFRKDFDEILKMTKEAASLSWTSQKRDRISTLWSLITGKIGSLDNYVNYLMAQDKADVATAYIDLLPVFQVFTLNFITVLEGMIEVGAWQIKRPAPGDNRNHLMCNYNSVLNTGRLDAFILLNWAKKAEDAIAESLTPDPTALKNCVKDDHGQPKVLGGGRYSVDDAEWTRDFDCGSLKAKHAQVREGRTYTVNPCSSKNDLQTINAELTMPHEHVCKFHVKGKWACAMKDASAVGAKLKQHAQRINAGIVSRIDKDWRPAFRKKYSETLRKFLDSLWKIPDKPSRVKCAFTPVAKPDLSQYARAVYDVSEARGYTETEGMRHVAQALAAGEQAAGELEPASSPLGQGALAGLMVAAVAAAAVVLRAVVAKVGYSGYEVTAGEGTPLNKAPQSVATTC